MEDKCEMPHCKNKSNLTYYGYQLCAECFGKFHEKELKEKLKIKFDYNGYSIRNDEDG